MYRNKILFTIILFLWGIRLNAQYGTTSSGGHNDVPDEIYHAYTIGEVINAYTLSSTHSVKAGIIQPIQKIVSSVSTTNEINVAIFPNPTVNYLKIEIQNQNNVDYQIFDVQGREIKNGVLHNKIINVEELEQGNYFLVLQTSDERITKPFQKINNK